MTGRDKIVRLPRRNGRVVPGADSSFRRIGIKALAAMLCILSTSCGSSISEKTECSADWLKVWNSRFDPQNWSYVHLAHYAQLGAHPDIPGYSSTDVAAYFAALAVKNDQGLDIMRMKLTISSEDMRKLHRALTMRDAIAGFYGIPVPQSAGAPRDKCIYTEASAACLPGLTRELLPKAEEMQQYLETAIRSHQLGHVPCKGSIQDFDNPNFR